MKLLLKLLLFLLAVAFCAFVWARATTAQAPQSNSSITNPPYGPINISQPNQALERSKAAKPTNTGSGERGGVSGGRHSTRAEKTISVEVLQQYLAKKESPLAPFAETILQSPYYSTIIGICTIEQYGCTKAPGNNYWGIGPGKRFATIPDGIETITGLLNQYESKGKDTIEELNCYYVQPCSNNWLNTVLETKQAVENLQ